MVLVSQLPAPRQKEIQQRAACHVCHLAQRLQQANFPHALAV